MVRAPTAVASSTRSGCRGEDRRRARSASTASGIEPTGRISTPPTSRASAAPSAGTTTRATPRRARARTIGSRPGTDRTSPPSESSPINAARPARAVNCSEPTRIPIAIARSAADPVLGRSAGARLTVMRRGGWTKPEFRSAPRTRSRASRMPTSASPTIVKPGRPGATSTSTRITRPSKGDQGGGEQSREHDPTLRPRAYPGLT